MLNQIKSPKNVLAFQLKGKVTAEEVASMKGSFEPLLKNNAPIGVVIDMTEFLDASEDAIKKNLEMEFGMLGDIEQFKRVAFITDKEWPGVLLRWASKIIPMTEIRTFRVNDKDEAVKWAAELSRTSETTRRSGFKMIRAQDDSVLAFEIDGKLSVQDLTSMAQSVEKTCATHKKVRALVRVKNFDWVEPAALFQADLFKSKLAALKKADRYALVGAPAWMEKMVEAVNPIFSGMDMKVFDAKDEAAAWKWLGSHPYGH